MSRFEADLREELNVKTVCFLGREDELVVCPFKPSLSLLGRMYGRLMPGSGAACRSFWSIRHSPIELCLEGQVVYLQPDDVLALATAPAGYTVARRERLVVALDTDLASELLQKGLARDLVRLIQDARKSADFALTDQVDLVLQPHAGRRPGPLLEKYREYIRSGIQASTLAIGPLPASFLSLTLALAGGEAMSGLRRCESADADPGV